MMVPGMRKFAYLTTGVSRMLNPIIPDRFSVNDTIPALIIPRHRCAGTLFAFFCRARTSLLRLIEKWSLHQSERVLHRHSMALRRRLEVLTKEL